MMSTSTEVPPPLLVLEVAMSSVGKYPTPPSTVTANSDVAQAMVIQPPTAAAPTDTVCLLSVPLESITYYSRQQHAQWLIDIAHDLIDPCTCAARYIFGTARTWPLLTLPTS
ncbi:hypothetical protein C8J57DRAFT_1389794 [Mycena rebaudengoi]|nr:hypothetical protein C8J57DRAFT_1389794 [Mycena rebaudengoi]